MGAHGGGVMAYDLALDIGFSDVSNSRSSFVLFMVSLILWLTCA